MTYQGFSHSFGLREIDNMINLMQIFIKSVLISQVKLVWTSRADAAIAKLPRSSFALGRHGRETRRLYEGLAMNSKSFSSSTGNLR